MQALVPDICWKAWFAGQAERVEIGPKERVPEEKAKGGLLSEIWCAKNIKEVQENIWRQLIFPSKKRPIDSPGNSYFAYHTYISEPL